MNERQKLDLAQEELYHTRTSLKLQAVELSGTMSSASTQRCCSLLSCAQRWQTHPSFSSIPVQNSGFRRSLSSECREHLYKRVAYWTGRCRRALQTEMCHLACAMRLRSRLLARRVAAWMLVDFSDESDMTEEGISLNSHSQIRLRATRLLAKVTPRCVSAWLFDSMTLASRSTQLEAQGDIKRATGQDCAGLSRLKQ